MIGKRDSSKLAQNGLKKTNLRGCAHCFYRSILVQSEAVT